MAENQKDSASEITADMIQKAFPQIIEAIQEMPTLNELKEIYDKLQIKAGLEDIDVPQERVSKLLDYSPCVRNRLTLMRLRKCIK